MFLLRRFKITDVPGNVSKGVPDFCNVYVISKGKISSMKSASRPAPVFSLRGNLLNQDSIKSDTAEPQLIDFAAYSLKGFNSYLISSILILLLNIICFFL